MTDEDVTPVARQVEPTACTPVLNDWLQALHRARIHRLILGIHLVQPRGAAPKS